VCAGGHAGGICMGLQRGVGRFPGGLAQGHSEYLTVMRVTV